jgi:Protein of unknown function (DUF2846)
MMTRVSLPRVCLSRNLLWHRMFRAALVALMLLMSGCTVYQSIGKSVGGFVHPVTGHDFVHIGNDKWSRDNALVYFYRPHSDWASYEIESPSVYIDDTHYFNFRNDSFTWFEVSPGQRHIQIRRPLLGLEGMGSFSLSMIADAMLTVEPGQIYYLRYSEVEKPEANYPGLPEDHPLRSGELQLVTREYAMQADEIVSTRFLNSDLLAPNHGAASIVRVTEDVDYQRRLDELEEERTAEIEQLKAAGKYSEPSWFWPFGGGPNVPLETDRKLNELEREYAALEREREREDADDGWWIF